MSSTDQNAFFQLFREAYEKCFSIKLGIPMSETESKHLSNEILELTGLVVGWKSIKNYSFFILNADAAKQENPSVATLDTLARYVVNAPKTDEVTRKKNEGHFGYWFNYRDALTKDSIPLPIVPKHLFMFRFRHGLILFILLGTLAFYYFRGLSKEIDFSDNFSSVDSLFQKGWILKGQDPVYWNRRSERPGHLTLFTLDGDNYIDTLGRIGIKNLLLKEIETECFSTEIHLSNYIPHSNWQQVGLLLMEDSTFNSKSIRLSLSFNNFFGGYTRPGEILLQAISASDGAQSKPEEIAHTVIFSADSSQWLIVKKNLQKAALRIEKRNNSYRFLYATGQGDIFAFKEIISRELPIRPKYVGIFALKGYKPDSPVIPAHIDFFNLKSQYCTE